jgi:DNA-binding beta-propeller fold protein YncE
VADSSNYRVQYFTAGGSFLGKWGTHGSANGQFQRPSGVDVAPNGNVYVADTGVGRIQYFTANGSFLGKWSRWGTTHAFEEPMRVAVAPDGNVFVADTAKDRILYFTRTGSFLGQLGQLLVPWGVVVSSNGTRVYGVSYRNHRVQYYLQTNPAVAPASLGRVKALFR